MLDSEFLSEAFGQRLRDAQRSFYETQGPVVPEVKTPKEAPPKAEAKAKMAFAAEVVESLPKKDTPELPESWRKKPATQDVLESARRKAKSAALPGALDEPEVHETPPSTRRRSASSRKSSLLSQKKGFGGYGGVADTEEVSPKEKQRYGPERFFYDQSSYTGVHRNGSPTTVDKEKVQHIVRESPGGGLEGSPLSARSRTGSMVSPRSASMRRHTVGFESPERELQEPDTARSSRRRTIAESPSGSMRMDSARHSLDASPRYGPERFFYDQNTYTGSHRHGGPRINGSKSLSQILRKDGDLDDLSPKADAEEQISPRRGSGASIASLSPRRRAQTDSLASPRSARSPSVQLENFRYGPERFFYDSRTYTGVHKNGGPCHVDIREPVEAGSPLSRSASRRLSIASTRSGQDSTL